MGRSLTPQDCHVLMTDLVKQATGRTDVAVVDTSSFVSAGELVLATGLENTLNALSILVGRTMMSVRPYDAKLSLFNVQDTGAYTSRLRKISFYSKDPQASGDWNTQSNGANLKAGATNGEVVDTDASKSATKSMWEQNPSIPLEMNFAGIDTWEESITIYEYQVKQAFRSEDEFGAFIAGMMTQKANDIEMQKEAFNRMTLLSAIAGRYAIKDTVGSSVVNLTAEFNKRFGTSYTSKELRTTHLEEFLKFFISQYKIYSDRMTSNSGLYHWTVEKNDLIIPRHTPKKDQRLLLYNPLFIESESWVFPTVFNDRYLKLENYEGVDYWQSIITPEQIDVKTAVPDVKSENGGLQKVTEEIKIPYVVGVLYDKEALMTQFQLESSAVTPLEARKRYYNTWWTFAKNAINDATENMIIFTMEDAATKSTSK